MKALIPELQRGYLGLYRVVTDAMCILQDQDAATFNELLKGKQGSFTTVATGARRVTGW